MVRLLNLVESLLISALIRRSSTRGKPELLELQTVTYLSDSEIVVRPDSLLIIALAAASLVVYSRTEPSSSCSAWLSTSSMKERILLFIVALAGFFLSINIQLRNFKLSIYNPILY